MSDISVRLSSLLSEAAGKLRTANADAAADGLDTVAREAGENCTIAVVGRVKTGKSSFINALLGDDLAAVGAQETTATINYFRRGNPNPDKPILCY